MKIFNKKRIASVVMAGVLALSLAAPAFAADNYSTTIEGSVADVPLNVLIPTSGEIFINPYGLPYKIGAAVIKGEQIAGGSVLTIQNKSEVALSTNVSMTVSDLSGVQYADTQYTDREIKENTTKLIRTTFELFKSDLTAESITDTAAVNTKFAALKSSDAVMTLTPVDIRTAVESTDTDHLYPTLADAKTNSANAAGILTGSSLILREANAEGAMQKGGAAFFRISGVVAEKPSDVWEETDTFKVKLAWTFIPAVYENNGGTMTFNTATVTAQGNNTGSLALNLPTGVTAKKVVWSSSDTSYATVSGDTSSSTNTDRLNVTAAVLNKSTNGQPVAITITAQITGSDGYPYVSRGTFNVNIP